MSCVKNGLVFLLCALVVGLVGCSADDSNRSDNGSDVDGDGDTDGDGDGDGGSDGDSDADADADTDTDTDTGTSTVCDEMDFSVEVLPARMMILLDASPSMGEDGKWGTATSAVTNLIMTWQNQIHFGFDVFPNAGSNCSTASPVLWDANGAPGVNTVIPGGSTGGSTPMYCGMGNFLDSNYAPIFSGLDTASYLVVVSDGADLCGKGCCVLGPNCRLMNSKKAFGDLATDLLAMEVKTFAISLNGENKDDLDAIATNGGTGFDESFDAAQDVTALNDAFATIAASAVSCTYQLADPNSNADRTLVNFYFDDDLVGYDEDCEKNMGWMWMDDEKTTVEFCEEACEQLREGGVDTVKATFGCNTIPVV